MGFFCTRIRNFRIIRAGRSAAAATEAAPASAWGAGGAAVAAEAPAASAPALSVLAAASGSQARARGCRDAALAGTTAAVPVSAPGAGRAAAAAAQVAAAPAASALAAAGGIASSAAAAFLVAGRSASDAFRAASLRLRPLAPGSFAPAAPSAAAAAPLLATGAALAAAVTRRTTSKGVFFMKGKGWGDITASHEDPRPLHLKRRGLVKRPSGLLQGPHLSCIRFHGPPARWVGNRPEDKTARGPRGICTLGSNLNMEVHPHTCWKGLGMWERVGDTHTNPDKLPCPNRRLPGKPTGAAVA